MDDMRKFFDVDNYNCSLIFQGSTAMGKLNARAKAGDEILKVGVTSPCNGEAVGQPDVSGCFRESDGDKDENLKIQASGVLTKYTNGDFLKQGNFFKTRF